MSYKDTKGVKTNFANAQLYRSNSPGGPSCPTPGWVGSSSIGFTLGNGSQVSFDAATLTALYTPPPPPTVTGFINPKYKIVGVVYSPPGSQSYVQYTNTTMMGTSTSTKDSFQKDETTSSTICGSMSIPLDIFTSDLKICGTYSNSFTQESDTSSSFAVNTTKTFVNKWPGSSDGLDHGNDVVYIWLNPVVWYTIPDTTPPVQNSVQWRGYSFDGADDYNSGLEMEVVPFYLSELLNPSTIDAYKYNRLQRTWALPNVDGTGPGLTDADLLEIAKADPFSDPNYVFSVPTTPAGNKTSSDGRFTLTANVPLIYQPGTATSSAPTYGYNWDYTTTQTQGKGAKHINVQGFALQESFSLSFFGGISLDLKQGLTFTWTDEWNRLTTNMMDQKNEVSVTGPAYCAPGANCIPYQGPEEFTVFQDNVYGTFMIYPVLSSFTISPSPVSSTVNSGGSATYTLSTAVNNGYTGTLTLSLMPGLPSGTSGSFSTNPISAGGSSTLTVNTSASTPAGTYPLAVLATDGTLIYYAYFTLVVSAPDFSISVSPASQTITAGSGTSYMVSTIAVHGFSGNVTLTTSGGLPAGVSATFSPNPVAASSSSTMAITSTFSTPPGAYSLTVNGTSGSLMHTVNPSPILLVNPAPTTTTTALVSSLNPSGLGQSVKFTATVSSPAGGTPTGSVVFKNGTATLATKTLSGAIATYSTTALPLGSSSITAAYGGDSIYTGSTSIPVVQVVQKATTTTLSSSRNPSAFGQSVTFTAAVTSSSGAPPNGETVSFMKGTTVLATGTLSGGSASFTTSTLPVATNTIKAVYGGDANFAGSTSTAVSQVVSPATTTVILVSSLNPSNFGQSVTLTATVVPQFSGTPTGTVTFYDGATALKTSSLSGGAANYTTTMLARGTHSIKATYNGSNSFTGSSASRTQTVN